MLGLNFWIAVFRSVAVLSAAAVLDRARLYGADSMSSPFGAGSRVLDGRIQRLLARALDHDIFPKPVKVRYSPSDMSLPEPGKVGDTPFKKMR